MELVVATRNNNKAKELRHLLDNLNIDVVTLQHFPEIPEIVEDGTTFEENAVKKAVTVAQATGSLTIADDSGLEVEALDGRPGIYSARYSGENATDLENNKKLLEELDGVTNRRARFVCCIALADKDGLITTVQGVCDGEIIDAPRGFSGFGYDPLFVKDNYTMTFAELPHDTKNRISHRAMALDKARLAIESYVFNKIGKK